MDSPTESRTHDPTAPGAASNPLRLSAARPFSFGGNRVCYVDPRDITRCIKLDRSDRTPADRRRRRKFPFNLRPLSSFDDNREEYRAFRDIQTRHDEEMSRHLPRCHGWVETDLGRGLVTDLVRDDEGRVSETLETIVWRDGFNAELRKAVGELERFWITNGILSRALLPHNVVVKRATDGSSRLVVIDGLGSPALVPIAKWFKPLAIRKARRKAAVLLERAEALEERRRRGLPATRCRTRDAARETAA
jgi:hypothetical protein